MEGAERHRSNFSLERTETCGGERPAVAAKRQPVCGIAGIVSKQPAESGPQILSAMLECLRHRGPDGSGQVSESEGRVLLGHNRLSVVELGPAGRQPMESACGRYLITFNGEIYNFLRLQSELRKCGYEGEFRGRSDSEVLLAAIAHWGLPEALRRAIGMFSLALWDRDRRQLWLGRDRIGKKPLYYGTCGRDFVFASELRAFRQHPDFVVRVDPAALTLYLRFGYVPSPLSILAGVYKLSPGHLFSEATGPQPYWSHADFAGQSRPVEASQARAKLLTLLEDAVALRLVADVPLGILLSGGVDSALITAVAQRQSTRPLKTFSVGFEDAMDESAHAARVAEYLGTDHTRVILGPEAALGVVNRLPQIYDEPFCDPSQVPTLLISQVARRDATVVLSGDGGDEIFAGYDRYPLCSQQWRTLSRVPPPLRRLGRLAVEFCQHLWPYGCLADRMDGLSELLRAKCLLDNYYRLAGFWNRPEKAMSHPVFSAEFEARLTATRLADNLENLMFYDAQTLLPDGILTKVDRASMAVSLEVRSPLLDHRVVEFAWGLPLSLKYAGGDFKWILKSLLYDQIPRALVDRPKQGFCIPLGSWLRGPWREWASHWLEPAELQRHGFFRAETLARTWHEFLHHGRSWHNRLWAIIIFQQWWSEFQADRQSNFPGRPGGSPPLE